MLVSLPPGLNRLIRRTMDWGWGIIPLLQSFSTYCHGSLTVINSGISGVGGPNLSGDGWKDSMINRGQIVSKASTPVEWGIFYMHMYGAMGGGGLQKWDYPSPPVLCSSNEPIQSKGKWNQCGGYIRDLLPTLLKLKKLLGWVAKHFNLIRKKSFQITSPRWLRVFTDKTIHVSKTETQNKS